MPPVWAVLPLKDFVSAKQRLSGVLTPRERRSLFQAMVEDVLDQLCACAEVNRVLLVSDDPVAELLAERYGATFIAEQGKGLNAAVQQGADYIVAQGGGRMLVLHGDIPLLQTQALVQLLQQPQAVLVVTDGLSQGSNLLLCPQPSGFRFFYGTASLQAHLAEAQRLGLASAVLHDQDLGLDIDEPQDLLLLVERLQQRQSAGRTAHYLTVSGIAQRLQQMRLHGVGPQSSGQTGFKHAE